MELANWSFCTGRKVYCQQVIQAFKAQSSCKIRCSVEVLDCITQCSPCLQHQLQKLCILFYLFCLMQGNLISWSLSYRRGLILIFSWLTSLLIDIFLFILHAKIIQIPLSN